MPPRTLTADTKLSAGGAFALNACFVAGLLVLSQLSSLQQRATVRTSIIVDALLLLAWPRGQHYLQACQQGAVILYWGYYWREVYHPVPLIAAPLWSPTRSTACSRGRTGTSFSCAAARARSRIDSRRNSTRAPASRVGLPPAGFNSRRLRAIEDYRAACCDKLTVGIVTRTGTGYTPCVESPRSTL